MAVALRFAAVLAIFCGESTIFGRVPSDYRAVAINLAAAVIDFAFAVIDFDLVSISSEAEVMSFPQVVIAFRPR